MQKTSVGHDSTTEVELHSTSAQPCSACSSNAGCAQHMYVSIVSLPPHKTRAVSQRERQAQTWGGSRQHVHSVLSSEAHGQLCLELVSVLPVGGLDVDPLLLGGGLPGLVLAHVAELLCKLEGLVQGLRQDKVHRHLHTACQVAHLQTQTRLCPTLLPCSCHVLAFAPMPACCTVGSPTIHECYCCCKCILLQMLVLCDLHPHPPALCATAVLLPQSLTTSYAEPCRVYTV